jgi:hypothetical protein
MKKSLSTLIPGWLLLYPLIAGMVPASVHAQPKGKIVYTLVWQKGHPVYSYVFTGVVSRHGKPVPHARIRLHVRSRYQAELLRETTATSDGRYELIVALAGEPEQAADWTLLAQAADSASEAAEVAGSTILMQDESDVWVQRPIELQG